MSFFESEDVAVYNIFVIRGDYFEFPVLFDFDITGLDFEWFATETLDGSRILDFDTSDFVIVAGDPDDVQNSATLTVGSDVTAEWDLACLRYRFRWLNDDRDVTVVVGEFSIKDV